MRRCTSPVVAYALAGALLATPVYAQDPEPLSATQADIIVTSTEDGTLMAAETVVVQATAPAPRRAPAFEPLVFAPLYGSFLALQVLDVVSTQQALDRGAVEGNPLMRGIADNPAAFVAVKAAQTAGTIWLTERLRKKHRTAAVALMIGINCAYAAVVAHNFGYRPE